MGRLLAPGVSCVSRHGSLVHGSFLDGVFSCCSGLVLFLFACSGFGLGFSWVARKPWESHGKLASWIGDGIRADSGLFSSSLAVGPQGLVRIRVGLTNTCCEFRGSRSRMRDNLLARQLHPFRFPMEFAARVCCCQRPDSNRERKDFPTKRSEAATRRYHVPLY